MGRRFPSRMVADGWEARFEEGASGRDLLMWNQRSRLIAFVQPPRPFLSLQPESLLPGRVIFGDIDENKTALITVACQEFASEVAVDVLSGFYDKAEVEERVFAEKMIS